MRMVRHPLVARDVIGIAEHILEVTEGDLAAVERRLDEIDALIAEIASNPKSGMRLGGAPDGWLVRHGGRGNRLTVVFRCVRAERTLFLAMIAFGGRNWTERMKSRGNFGE